MKILFIHDNARVCETLAKGLVREGHTVSLLGCSTKHYRLIPALALTLERMDADVVVANEYTSWVVAEIVRRFWRKKIIIILHGTEMRTLAKRKLCDPQRILLTKILRGSSIIFATTDDLLAYSYVSGKKIFHLPLPIDTCLFNNSAPKNETLLGDPIIFSPTRLMDPKGGESILRIIQKIVAHYPYSHVYQVKWGDPKYLSRLLTTIPSRNLSLVDLIPHESLPSWYVTSDVVIGQLALGILSNIELEAMSCKTPVIVYDKYNHYGCPSKNPERIWQTASRLLEDSKYRKNLLLKGSKLISEKHDLQLVAHQYIQNMESVLSTKN